MPPPDGSKDTGAARSGCCADLLPRALLKLAPWVAPLAASRGSASEPALRSAVTARVTAAERDSRRAELRACAHGGPALPRTGSAIVIFDRTVAARRMVHEFRGRIRANFVTRYVNAALMVAAFIACSALPLLRGLNVRLQMLPGVFVRVHVHILLTC